MSLGPFEIILIIAVIALLFGAKKLPELGKGVGQGIREFKREVKDENAVVTVVTDVPSQQLDPVSGGPVTGASLTGTGTPVASSAAVNETPASPTAAPSERR